MTVLAHGLTWQPHPEVWLAIGALGAAYWWALRTLAPRHAPAGMPATSRQQLWFATGLVVMWVGADWPLHDLAEDYLYSVHMVQHMLFQFVAAPLLVLGTPAWLWRLLLPAGWVRTAFGIATRPLNALVLVGGFTAVLHLPMVVNATASTEWLHFLVHVALLGIALIMWWPVVSPLPELPHLSYAGRMTYLFLHSVLPTVPASFLTYARTPLYSWYADAPRLAAWLDPVQDLQMAGLVMKIGGGLLLWGIIAVLFFRWAAAHDTGAPDPLYWQDVAPEVDRAAREATRGTSE